MTIAVALAVAIPVLVVTWNALRPLDGAQGGLGLVDVPPVGQVSAANLADGHPVFVVHQIDGTVEVIDAFSTHDPYGLSKLVAWCPSSRTFDDVFHGSRWDESGTYMLGPAPSGLATYQSTIQPDGRVLVGSQVPSAPRPSPGNRVNTVGAFCRTSDELTYPSIPGNVSDSPADVVASAPEGWVAVRGSLIRGGPTGAELCSRLARGSRECAQGAPVEGIDVRGLFKHDPGLVISETFISRVRSGSLVELTRVPEPGHPKVVP
jgi:hypothetical protein